MHIVPGKCGIEWWRNEHDERLLPDDDTPAQSKFFRNPEGNPIPNMNKELSRFQTGYGIVRKTTKADDLAYTAINARKSMETANLQHYRGNTDAQRKVSDYFAHSHYMA